MICNFRPLRRQLRHSRPAVDFFANATVQSILIKQQHSDRGAAEPLRVLSAYQVFSRRAAEVGGEIPITRK